MEASMPVLVTRLPDRRALTRMVRAALRHEVVQVALNEGPRKAQAHTLDLRVEGGPTLALIAEPAGAPRNGTFPLRLRPLHRAQAAELYALLESEGPSTPESPTEDSDPIARAMSGAAPAVAAEMSVPESRPSLSDLGLPALPPDFDPRRTAPSAAWTSNTPSNAPRREEVKSWVPTPRSAPDDPRRTSPSAAWLGPAPRPPPADDVIERSISVVFEPDLAVPDLSDHAADGESVSVVFESDAVDTSQTTRPENGPQDEPFFDDALANLPNLTLPTDDDARTIAEPGPPVAKRNSDLIPDLYADDPQDDELDTLVRFAALPLDQKPLDIVHPAARDPGEHTPTSDIATPPKKSATGGRKRKTTRRGKAPEKRAKRATHHDDDEPHSRAESSRRRDSSAGDMYVGRKIADGKYVIEAAIGSGAAGTVYKATHRELRRTVAVKVLHPHYQHDPHFMKSFRGEALAASQLDHPNVMRVLDFGQESDGLVYIVMEYLSGRTLQSVLDEERRLPLARAVELMVQVCAGLSIAHDNGIIHRDIKPDNIMLVTSRNDEGATYELVKVCDFGIAALHSTRADDPDIDSADAVIAGTPEYMSPEQVRGHDVDARSDVYACGICLYELVTGRPPFVGDNPAEILIKQLEETPKPPSHHTRGLDPVLEEIIVRTIEKDPSKRPQSARELRVELKELIDPGEPGSAAEKDERSIVENVPVLDDPASGFPGFFIALSSCLLRFGRFERGHPEAPTAMKELLRSTRMALRGRAELTFARRDTQKTIGFCVMTGTSEIVDLRRLLGSQLYGSFGQPFIDFVVKKGIAALTIREGIPDTELTYLIEMLLGPLADDALRKEMFGKPLRYVSPIFVSDVVGRERKLSWKVGLAASRLARDFTALSTVRGISLKKMRELRQDLVAGIAHLLTHGDEVRQFLFNTDLVDDVVQNLRGFSSFRVGPMLIERLLHAPIAETTLLLVADLDKGQMNPDVVRSYLQLLIPRLLDERSPAATAAVTELYRRGHVTDTDLPREIGESIRAQALADAISREPTHFLRALDLIGDPESYEHELTVLEAAMAVLARRGEATSLLTVIATLARHAKASPPTGRRETAAFRTMKSMIEKQRLVPIAHALLTGPAQHREAARQLLVLAGSSGAQALLAARETVSDPAARAIFVRVFRETGPAGWSLLSALLPRVEVRDDAELGLVEDLLRTMPERSDPVLGDAVARFLAHPRLRPAALAAIVPLWGERARKPLIDALEFAEEPARMVAVAELRRMRAIDEQVVGVIERLLTMRGSASEELRAAAAAALAFVVPTQRTRAIQMLAKTIEGKRGIVAILRGDGVTDEPIVVIEAMARALLALDRNEGIRALKSRLQRSEGAARARLTALLQGV